MDNPTLHSKFKSSFELLLIRVEKEKSNYGHAVHPVYDPQNAAENRIDMRLCANIPSKRRTERRMTGIMYITCRAQSAEGH
jgi:hypothetical protein